MARAWVPRQNRFCLGARGHSTGRLAGRCGRIGLTRCPVNHVTWLRTDRSAPAAFQPVWPRRSRLRFQAGERSACRGLAPRSVDAFASARGSEKSGKMSLTTLSPAVKVRSRSRRDRVLSIDIPLFANHAVRPDSNGADPVMEILKFAFIIYPTTNHRSPGASTKTFWGLRQLR